MTAAVVQRREASIAQLTATSLLSHRIEGCTAHFLYRHEAKQAVEQLVQQEQACCAFPSFEMRQSSDGIALTITAPPEAKSDAETLFAQLLPSQKTRVDTAVANEARSCGCVSSC